MKIQGSWFIISLEYVRPLEDIDAAMADHVKFLNKHRKQGAFIVWGRKVPRTGGIIIGIAKDLAAIHRIMATDPFVARKLARFEVTEFMPKPAALVDAVQALLET